MVKLFWMDKDYEVGVDRGVFFPQEGQGEVWNGLISVDEVSSELKSRVKYRDGKKYTNRRSEDSFSATIKTYTYPLSFSEYELVSRRRKEFGFSYRIKTENGYKIHLVYNAIARMSSVSYTQSDTASFSFDISTRPLPIPGGISSAHLIVDVPVAYSWTVAEFEDVLYGSDTNSSRLPTPQEVFDIFEVNSILRIIDNGDGTWTAIGPDSAIQMIHETRFEITWPSAIMLDDISYTISSL